MLESRVFRLFISSTFSDFRCEREALQQKVFPRLEEFCAERGSRFQAVDLRWGITDEAQKNHDTIRICLEEVRRAQELSPRPNFAVLLGDRYGWEPAPACIPSEHWKRLVRASTPADRRIIRAAYEGPDRNVIPPVFRLRPRSGGWEENQKRENILREALRRVVDTAGFEGFDRLPYFTSATHQEIVLGTLQAENAPEQVNVYVRRVEGLPMDSSSGGFIDWDSTVNGLVPGARERLQALEGELRKILPGRVREYRTSWKENGVDGAYLDAFCEQFYADQKAIIEEELTAQKKVDESQSRALLHARFAQERARNFTGRRSVLRKIENYLNRPGLLPPLIVHGDGGSGKSALLAHSGLLISAGKPKTGKTPVVIARFIGGVPGTESLFALLVSLVSDIAAAYGRPSSSVEEGAKEAFLHALGFSTESQPLFIFLDALDQLDPSDGAWLLEWLPKRNGANTRIVASTRSGAAMQAARHRFAKSIIAVPSMTRSEGRQMLDALLGDSRTARLGAGLTDARGRKLTNPQYKTILATFQHSGKPLWLKLVCEEACSWSSWTIPRSFPESTEEMIQDLVNRWTAGENHPQRFAAQALAYISAGRFGLAEHELGLALATDPLVKVEFQKTCERTNQQWDLNCKNPVLPPILWSRLYSALQPYLSEARVDGSVVYRYFHREFKEVIEAKLLHSESKRRELHGNLAAAFQRLAPDDKDLFRKTDILGIPQGAALRRVMEQPWQLSRAGDFQASINLVTDFGFCMAKCAANRSDDLSEDLLRAQRLCVEKSAAGSLDSFLNALADFVLSNAHLLRRGNAEWPAHRIFLQLASEQASQSPVTNLCDNWLSAGLDNWRWIRCVDRPLGNRTQMRTLEGHSGGFDSFIATELIAGKLLSRHNDYRVWDLETGRCEAVYDFEAVLVVACSARRTPSSPRASHLPGGCNLLWAVGIQTLRFRHCGWEGMSMCQAVELEDGRIVLRDHETSAAIIHPTEASVCPIQLSGHQKDILGFAEISGGRIVTWSEDATYKVWDFLSGECLHTSTAHVHPVFGVIEIPEGRLVSWDENGNFYLTSIKEWLTRPLDHFDEYNNEKDGGDHACDIGAMWLSELESARLLTWSWSRLNWHDAECQLLHGCTPGGGCCVTFMPGVGVARVFEGEDAIVITDFTGRDISQFNARAATVSGVKRLDDGRLVTWTGYKGGDDTLSIWEAPNGDWSFGHPLIPETVDTKSRCIYNVYNLSGGRIVSCSEDDALRVWHLSDLREKGQLGGDDKRYVADVRATDASLIKGGLTQVSDFNYSSDKKPLVLVDAQSSKIQTLDCIQVGMISPIIQRLSSELIVLDGWLVVDIKRSAVIKEFSKENRTFTLLEENKWLTYTPKKFSDRTADHTDHSSSMGGQSSQMGGEIFLCLNINDDFMELGGVSISMLGMNAPIPVGREHFVVWGSERRIQLWKVNGDEWPEQNDILSCLGEVVFTESPRGLISLPGLQLAAWFASGQIAIVSTVNAAIVSNHEFPEALSSVELTPNGCLVCGSPGGLIRFLSPSSRLSAEVRCETQAVAGLESLQPLSDRFILSFSAGGILQRWDRSLNTITQVYPNYGLSSPQIHSSKGHNILLQVHIAQSGRFRLGILLFNSISGSLHLLESNQERLALHDETDCNVCYWHFNRGADRDANDLVAITSLGGVLAIANGRLNHLQVMRFGKAYQI